MRARVVIAIALATSCSKHDAASDGPPSDSAIRDSPARDAQGPDAGAVWNARPCDYYVAATGGNDANAGSRSAPFATIGHLQTTLRAATSKVGCLEAGSGGSYNLTTGIVLAKGVDDGETWQSDPEGGVDSAVLDGGSTVGCLISIGADDVTIDGLTLQHVINNLICHDDGVTTIANLTVTNNDIGFNTKGPGSGGFPPCLMVNGLNGGSITHNFVHDCASMGIGLFAFQSGLVFDNTVVDRNVVLRAVQAQPDGGAIYLDMHANYTASSIMITNNFVRDYGAATVDNAHGIYFDEGTNHVTAAGNIVAPAIAGSAVSTGCLIADGHDNHFVGNICDLGKTRTRWSGVWWYPASIAFTPANNTYSGNIVVSSFAGNQQTDAFSVAGPSFVQIGSTGDPSIRNNVYFNYGDGQVRTDGNHESDVSPVLVDPLCSGDRYALAANSPAFAPPTNFEPLADNWGPPGFAIPPAAERSCP